MYKSVPWEPKTLIGGHAPMIIDFFTNGWHWKFIDGSQNAVWSLLLEDEFRSIMKIAVTFYKECLVAIF